MNYGRGVCATPGCYGTTYDSSLCNQCLDGKTPDKRGPVTIFEARYARNYGAAIDGGVTHARLVANRQPTNVLEPDAPSILFDTERSDLNGQTIIQIGSSINAKLIEYFCRHPNDLKTMDRHLFEELIAELFRGFGYEIELTKRTRDGGKDIIAIRRHEVDVKYLIECKRPDPGNPVAVSAVRELLGVKNDDKATKAILATTTYLSPDAKYFVDRHRWELEAREFEGVRAWIVEYLRSASH